MIDHDEFKEVLEALESGFLDTADLEPYMQIICNALEKQIPKKIKTVYLETICPYCGKIFYVGDPNTVMIYNFCPDCGQALDWSDENE